MIRAFLILVLVSWFCGAQAQSYRFKTFRVEQGLPTDMVKDVAMDQRGFLWICTDDGVVLYNARTFKTFKSILTSHYTKRFLNSRSNELFMIGDMDFMKITNQIDTILFELQFRGTHEPTDTSVWFPKGIFEDTKGRVWLSEPQSIARIKGKNLKRYSFSNKTRSPSFLRSYSIVEGIDQEIFAASYQGDLYFYNESDSAFVELPETILKKSSHVQGAERIGNSGYFITRDGLYQGTLGKGTITGLKRIFESDLLTTIKKQSDSILWIGSGRGKLYRVNATTTPVQVQQLDYNFTTINNITLGKNDDIWVSTDRGLVQVQPNLFELVNPENSQFFVEAVVQGDNHDYYYAIKEELYKIKRHPSIGQQKTIYKEDLGYFQSLVYDSVRHRLWAANTARVLLFENDKLVRTFDYIKKGQFIHELYLDAAFNLWITQDNNDKVMCITPDLVELSFALNGHTPGLNLNSVREGPDGMYVSSSGTRGYLFFCAKGSKVFENISVPIKFPITSGFVINDFTLSDEAIWLGTTEGLVKFDRAEAVRVDLGPIYSTLGIRSIERLAGTLVYSNSYGIFNYNYKNNTFILYDESSGLPSRNMSSRGIYLDKQGSLWIATSGGLAYAREFYAKEAYVPPPVCISAKVNGRDVPFMNSITLGFGELLDLSFTSLIFNDLPYQLQMRLNPAAAWEDISTDNLVLNNLSPGKYKMEIRQRTGSSMNWSESFALNIEVQRPFWQRPAFIIIVLVVISAISYASYAIGAYLVNKRKQILEELVNKRTSELQVANAELSQRNSELDRFVYSASHDLSAPLKSILGLITIAKLENPTKSLGDYLAKMEVSVKKLENFIGDVVSYSRNSRLPPKLEPIHFEPFVRNLLEDHRYSDGFERIDFIIEDKYGKEIITDTVRLKIIINNLVSNAIKFHRFSGGNTPFVTICLEQSNEEFVITVADNGLGIGQHHIAKIFEMFYRANDSIQGSGLGLYILKETVVKMGGNVRIDSRVGSGTTFTITLPLQQGETSK